MADIWDDEQISGALEGLDGWEREGNALVRTAKLPSFPAAIDAVRAVAQVAESRNHHPDIDIRFRTVTFRCSTHSEGGITGKDVELAGEIERILDGVIA